MRNYATRHDFIEITLANLSVVWVVPIPLIVYLPTIVGSLSLKKWGRYLGLTTGIVSIITGVYLLLPTPFILGVITVYISSVVRFLFFVILVAFGISAIVYLMMDVKYIFE